MIVAYHNSNSFNVMSCFDADEWNAAQVVRKNTKPVIMMRAGRVIAPIKLPKKVASQNRKSL